MVVVVVVTRCGTRASSLLIIAVLDDEDDNKNDYLFRRTIVQKHKCWHGKLKIFIWQWQTIDQKETFLKMWHVKTKFKSYGNDGEGEDNHTARITNGLPNARRNEPVDNWHIHWNRWNFVWIEVWNQILSIYFRIFCWTIVKLDCFNFESVQTNDADNHADGDFPAGGEVDPVVFCLPVLKQIVNWFSKTF